MDNLLRILLLLPDSNLWNEEGYFVYRILSHGVVFVNRIVCYYMECCLLMGLSVYM
jgi:hypothetical protein